MVYCQHVAQPKHSFLKSPFQAVLGGKEQLGVGGVVTEMGVYYSYFNEMGIVKYR